MIRINLLPLEFRIKPKSPERAKYLRWVIMAGVIFSIITVWFYVDYLQSSGKKKMLNKKWEDLQPKFNELNTLKTEVEGKLKQEQEFMEKFVTTQRPLTSILSWLSEFLPESAWLEEIQMDRDKGKVSLLVRGECLPSKDKTSIENIEIYLQNLKQKMPDAKLSLKTTRMEIQKIELTQFIANFDWNELGNTV